MSETMIDGNEPPEVTVDSSQKKQIDAKHRKECGARLVAERERLKCEPLEFAEMLGFGKSTQYRYEKGERSPDGEYLSAAHKKGVDILYVITGNRTGVGVMQEQPSYTPAERLADGIRTLTLSEEDAEILRGLAARLSQ